MQDSNHVAVVEALRGIGCMVQSLTAVKSGCPDLLVGYHGRLFLLEVKDGALKPSARGLNELERAWHSAWAAFQVFTVESAADAIEVAKRIERRNRENT